MEDILTSCVFGVLRYLSPEEGLIHFLRKTQTIDGLPHPIIDALGHRITYGLDHCCE
jgi:hypothetical protein